MNRAPKTHAIWYGAQAILFLMSCGCSRPLEHWSAQPPKRVTGVKDFNLLWTGLDENGLPVNPFWGPQQQNPGTLPAVTAVCNPTNAPFSQTCTDQSVM